MEHNDNKMENNDKKTGEDKAPPNSNQDSSINGSNIKTVKMSNLSTSTGKDDVEGFISFSGDIQYIEMKRESETTQAAFVTFKNAKDAETAILLSGATIGPNAISITLVENYNLPHDAVLQSNSNPKTNSNTTTPTRAEDMVSTMLAKGFILGQDALNKAKTFDEKHNLTSKASATVASIDNRIGLTEKLSVGAAVVNEKVKAMDEKYQVSQKASNAGTAIMSNSIVSTGASWVSSAFGKVAKAAEGVSIMTKEKLEKADGEKKEAVQKEQRGMVNDFANFQLDDSPVKDTSVIPTNSVNDQIKAIDQTNHANGTDQTKHVDQIKPTDQTKHVDQTQPTDQTKHVDQTKPTDQTKHVDQIKPTDQTKPVDPIKPTDQTKSVDQIKPTDQTGHVDQIKPTEQTNPVDPIKPTDQTNFNGTDQTKPVDQIKATTSQTNPVNSIDQTKAIDQTNPANSQDQTKTSDQNKPADQTKPI